MPGNIGTKATFVGLKIYGIKFCTFSYNIVNFI